MQHTPKHKGPAMNVLMAEALHLFWEKGFTADRVLGELFRRHKLQDDKRRGEVADMFLLLVRFWRPISVASEFSDITSTAEMHDLLTAAGQWRRIYAGESATGGYPQLIDRLERYMRVRKIRESVPDWFDEQGERELGAEVWERMLKALNRPAPIFLRTNTLRTTRAALQERLQEEGIVTIADNDLPEALRLPNFNNVFGTKAYQEGLFEVQDLSSQRVAVFAQITPGMRVVDACAGNGGKTLHLAALLSNKGKLLAFDSSEPKLDVLRKRAARAGVDTLEVKHIDTGKVIKRQETGADRLLLDVPCTGTGVLRRNPDIRWKLQPDDVSRLLAVQQQLLQEYSKMVKPGGKLIYATCSIWPSEGEAQVKAFLSEHHDWKLEDEYRTNPIQENSDGFYMARLLFSGATESTPLEKQD